jgi:hypothetical protein
LDWAYKLYGSVIYCRFICSPLGKEAVATLVVAHGAQSIMRRMSPFHRSKVVVSIIAAVPMGIVIAVASPALARAFGVAALFGMVLFAWQTSPTHKRQWPKPRVVLSMAGFHRQHP